jgi:hypothetical protein
MRILYLSSHSVLEYDEVRLLRELGHYVFSPGAYVCPENRGEADLRPEIPGLVYDPEDAALYHKCGVAGADNKAHLSAELVKRFDAVICMHMPEWIHSNRDVFAQTGVRLIWRTIGQSIAEQEEKLRHIRNMFQIVRYSPAEDRIPKNIGADALIRFYKDPEEWKDWNGGTSAVLNITQDMLNRAKACGWSFYEKVTAPFARTLIGKGSEVVTWGKGKRTYEETKAALRDYRCYFYAGTHPASYTLAFIEALMTGIPIVAVGPNHGNDPASFPGHRLYEVPEILVGGSGFASDDPFALMDVLAELLRNQSYAETMGRLGRARAIHLFGKETIKEQWKAFLGPVS